MQRMLCLIDTGPETIMMGGNQKTVFEFNTRRSQIVNKVMQCYNTKYMKLRTAAYTSS
jgi:hypothetical protein